MSDDSFSATLRKQIVQAVSKVRETTPLAQSFTNFVTMNLVANAQLAAGGTAAMSFLPDDVIDTAEIAGSNYNNVGTLLPFFKDALPEIARKLHENGKTWVLDPVAAGIGETRTVILESFRDYPPTIVRGNASEIIALDSMWGLTDTDSTVPATRPAGVDPSKWRCLMRFGMSPPRKSPPPKSSSTRLCRTLHTMRHVMQSSAIAYSEKRTNASFTL